MSDTSTDLETHRPPPPLLPAPWVDTLDQTALTNRRVVPAAAAIAVAFDIALRHEMASVATVGLVAVIVVGLFWSRLLVSPTSVVAASGALACAPWLAVRASPWLVPFNAVSVAALTTVAVATARRGRIDRWGFREAAAAPARIAAQVVEAGAVLSVPLRAPRRTGPRPSRIAFGLVLAAPVIAIVGGLLASGDDAFAELLDVLFGGQLVSHLVLLALGALLGFSLLRSAGLDDSPPFSDPGRRLGSVETITVLAGLAGLYALFATAQAIAAFTDLGAVLADPARTSTWARSGFFRLLWASGITLMVLQVLDHVGAIETRRHRSWYRAGVITVAGLSLVAVATAVYRIAEYSSTFGMTLLRFYSMAFAGWIAVVFVLFAAMVWGVGAGRRWFFTAVGGAALASLLVLNAINPERIVANDAFDRADAPDVETIRTLSSDGLVVVAERLDDVTDPADRRALLEILCTERRTDRDALHGNRSERRLAAATDELC